MINYDADNYTIRNEAEWKEILKNHGMAYYPRFKDCDAEDTFMRIRQYFSDAEEKPVFCYQPKRTVDLERRLKALYRALSFIEDSTEYEDKLEAMKIRVDIKYIESLLKVKR